MNNIELLGIAFIVVIALSLMIWASWPDIQKHRKDESLITKLWIQICGDVKNEKILV